MILRAIFVKEKTIAVKLCCFIGEPDYMLPLLKVTARCNRRSRAIWNLNAAVGMS